MNKSEQQMWDAIKSHYKRHPEKWEAYQEGKDTFYFDSTGVRVTVYYTSSGYTAYCMGIEAGYYERLFWMQEAQKFESKQAGDKALSVIKALEENS